MVTYYNLMCTSKAIALVNGILKQCSNLMSLKLSAVRCLTWSIQACLFRHFGLAICFFFSVDFCSPYIPIHMRSNLQLQLESEVQCEQATWFNKIGDCDEERVLYKWSFNKKNDHSKDWLSIYCFFEVANCIKEWASIWSNHHIKIMTKKQFIS